MPPPMSKRIPNYNTLADVIDRLIVEVNKLSFFENKKREEQAKPDKDVEAIARWDNLSRDCCEFRNMLKGELNYILAEIVASGHYETLKDARTFFPPKKSVADLIIDMCEEGPERAKKELAEAFEYELRYLF